MLKSDLDTDELIKSIRDARTSFTLSSQNVSNSNNQKYALYILSNLLEKPSEEYLNALIISTQDNFYYFTNILKTLIKTKFLQLSCQENIVTIINMFYEILDDKKIAEPVIANLLRYSSFYPVLQKLATNDIFTMYFKGIIGTIENPSITFGRDFVFEKACNSLLAPDHKIACYKGVKYLQYQTPRQFLITKISSTLELNLIFYIEKVNSNHHFYDFLLFNNYITSLEIAKDVLRYLVGVYYTNSTDKLINLISKILEYYNSETLLVAIFYDALFHQKNEEVNHFLFFYLCSKITNSAICNFLKERMKNDEIRQYFLCWLSKFGSKAQSIAAILEIDYVDLSHIQRRIELLDFDSYHGLISDMRVTKVPFIAHSIYNKIIDASFTWDGYMQVFLWKILAYQKIFFKFDVSYSNLETAESREGYEILVNIK